MIESEQEAIELLLEYYSTKKELKEAIESGDIHDAIHEIADSNVDVYTADLVKWAGDTQALAYIEDAIDEFGFPESDGKPDLIKAYMQGQYRANEELLNEAIEEL